MLRCESRVYNIWSLISLVLKFIYLYQDTSYIFKQISNLVQNKYKVFDFFNKHSIRPNLFDIKIGHEKEIVKNYCQSIYNKTASFWGRSLCLSRTFWGEEPVSVSTQAPPPKWNMPKHAHHHQMSSPWWRNLWWRNNQHHHQMSRRDDEIFK